MSSEANVNSEMVITRSKVADYIMLTKPELTLLSVATAMAGSYLGTVGQVDFTLMLHTFIGTLFIGAGAGALNQYIERKYDAMMKRTENRPLPSGRMLPAEVLLFGIILSMWGVTHLFLFTNPLTSFLGATTSISYLFLYTPLKRITSLSTVVGAIPGALPPVMGWTAVRSEITIEACVLFAILFLWQMPHFLSLSWMYRKDYARAGYPMLAVLDDDGSTIGRQIMLYCSALIPATIASTLVGLTGMIFLLGGVLLGVAFLVCGIFLLKARTIFWARRVFFASLVYLPALLTLMSIDKR